MVAVVNKPQKTCAFHALIIGQCNRKIRLIIYTVYFRPNMEYATPVSKPHTKHNTNTVEIVQHKCARYVSGNFDPTITMLSLVDSLLNLNFELANIGRKTFFHHHPAVMYGIFCNQMDIIGSLFSPEPHFTREVTAAGSLGSTMFMMQPFFTCIRNNGTALLLHYNTLFV